MTEGEDKTSGAKGETQPLDDGKKKEAELRNALLKKMGQDGEEKVDEGNKEQNGDRERFVLTAIIA